MDFAAVLSRKTSQFEQFNPISQVQSPDGGGDMQQLSPRSSHDKFTAEQQQQQEQQRENL